jgi:abi family protein
MGLFFIPNERYYFMPTNIKQPTTIEQQIEQLKSRGMIINDESDIHRWLSTVGYYRLSGYWWMYEERYPVCVPREHKFKKDTSWDQIKHTYIFDQKFRRLISTGIEKIEVAVKASWAQYLATHYNTSHPHEDSSIFYKQVCEPSTIKGVSTSFDLLVQAYQNSKERFALHYKTKYPTINTPPIWVSSLLLTLGELLNWMKGIKKRPDKKAIFANFPFDYKPMQSVLNNLRWVRNVCAHNGRLWNKRTPFVFVPIKDIDSRLIKSSSNNNELDSKIYNTIIAMAEILKTIDPDYPFIYFIKDLIIHSKYINPKLMGFPDDWEVIPEWKNPSPLPRHVIAKKEKRNKRRSKRK